MTTRNGVKISKKIMSVKGTLTDRQAKGMSLWLQKTV
jgi:hypothetical protein